MRLNRIALLFALVAVIIAIAVNECNLYYLRQAGVELRNGQCVKTNDDFSYLQPIQNYLHAGSYYTNDVEKYKSILRAPGYGLAYLMCTKIFGLNKALLFLKMLQLLLFGLSVYCFVFIAQHLFQSRKWTLAVAGLYAFLPFSMGFLYYTLTEALTPALVIFFVFFLIKANECVPKKGKLIFYFIASLSFAYLVLTRPFLGVLGLALPFFIWRDFFLKEKPIRALKNILVFGLICFSLLAGWQARNYRLLGKFTSLHPVYQNENPGMFRETHLAIWGFWKGWESKGSIFHETLFPLWEKAIAGDTSAKNIDPVMAAIPVNIVGFFGDLRLRNAFRLYQQSTLAQKTFFDQDLVMPSRPLPMEDSVINVFNQLSSEFTSHFWFTYHVVTPLKVFKNLAFHSNLSLYVFQHPWRGNPVMEMLRWICFIVHSLAFLLCLLFVFMRTEVRYKILFGVCLLFYLFYLTYVQRGIEERYTLPLLPLVLLSAAFVVKQLVFEKIRKKSTTLAQP
jgi:hypothetical protein